jgi:hypothetical protein
MRSLSGLSPIHYQMYVQVGALLVPNVFYRNFLLTFLVMGYLQSEFHFYVIKKVKLSLLQAVKAHRGVRGRGSHIF